MVVNYSGDPAPAEEVAERVRSHDAQALAHRADVADEQQVSDLFRRRPSWARSLAW
ncbi:hypothetical protein [Streptomyces sp. AA4]|uniref:hypothetical protein n=1 Tax=Streptomyces sp. AA4 TaxID=591158 RepID=UPI0001B55158|nr:hypothetical protein [Streptomyces sp. AA4]